MGSVINPEVGKRYVIYVDVTRTVATIKRIADGKVFANVKIGPSGTWTSLGRWYIEAKAGRIAPAK